MQSFYVNKKKKQINGFKTFYEQGSVKSSIFTIIFGFFEELIYF